MKRQVKRKGVKMVRVEDQVVTKKGIVIEIGKVIETGLRKKTEIDKRKESRKETREGIDKETEEGTEIESGTEIRIESMIMEGSEIEIGNGRRAEVLVTGQENVGEAGSVGEVVIVIEREAEMTVEETIEVAVGKLFEKGAEAEKGSAKEIIDMAVRRGVSRERNQRH